MVLFWIFAVVIIGCTAVGLIAAATDAGSYGDGWVGWAVVGFVAAIIAAIWLSISTYQMYDHAGEVKYSDRQLEVKAEQRDTLLALYEDELDPTVYAQLAQAVTPEDVLVILQNQQVGVFLTSKADALAKINSEYFELQNSVLSAAKDLCKALDNPMMLRAPFLSPDCPSQTLTEVPG